MSNLISELIAHHETGVALKARLDARLNRYLSFNDALALHYIQQNSPNVGQLGESLDMTQQAVGKKLQILSRKTARWKPLLTVKPGEDKRSRAICLTNHGMKLVEKLQEN